MFPYSNIFRCSSRCHQRQTVAVFGYVQTEEGASAGDQWNRGQEEDLLHCLKGEGKERLCVSVCLPWNYVLVGGRIELICLRKFWSILGGCCRIIVFYIFGGSFGWICINQNLRFPPSLAQVLLLPNLLCEQNLYLSDTCPRVCSSAGFGARDFLENVHFPPFPLLFSFSSEFLNLPAFPKTTPSHTLIIW